MRSAELTTALDRVDKIADLVREHASECERIGQLTAEVVDALDGADLFRILVPREFGGMGLTIPEAVTVLERVARLDASTAWTLGILSGGSLFARFMSRSAFEMLCRERNGFVAATLNPATATAEQVDGGYAFSGKATYLSGAAHARWVMANAVVVEGGQPAVRDGMLQMRAGLFPIEHARSLDTWHVTGMRATGSSDYVFDNVMVTDDWTFSPMAPHSVDNDDPFAAIPLWAQLGGVLTACVVGAARNMIDRFVELAATKIPTGGNFARLAERAPAQLATGEARGLYQAARSSMNDSVGRVWERGCAREPFDIGVLARQRVGLVTAVRLATQAVDLLHDAAGMNAVAADTVLERCWRDVHTMTQHVILSPARFEIVGRVLLGVDPGAPVI